MQMVRKIGRLGVLIAASLCLCGGGALLAANKHADSTDAGPAKPPTPEIESLELQPSSLTLADGRDGRQVLVWGVTKEGRKFDLSDTAAFTPDSDSVTISDGRYLYPAKVGETSITVSAEGKEIKLPVKVTGADQLPVRFGRDVLPMMASVGCN